MKTLVQEAWPFEGPRPSEERTAPSVKELMESVYPELRRAARAVMLGERAEHTLQPTALVHEAIIRILGLYAVKIQNAEHFFSIAVRQMRRVLASHARKRLAQKRSGGVAHDAELCPDSAGINIDQIVVVDEVLDRLAAIDPRAHKVVTLRFFGALSVEETAAVLNISPVTVLRDWEFARSWLYGELL